jgi:RNA methyltransferase, TrmH family
VKLLTLARDLKRRKAREKRSLFIAEGARSVGELLKSGLTVEGAIISPLLENAPRGVSLVAELRTRGIEVLDVSDADFASAADTDSPQGVLAIARVPHQSLDTILTREMFRIVVLDAVQDPGNAGTILRTAAALGAAATIALPGTVDLWNAKVVRSSMGTQFTHPAMSMTTEDFANLLRRESIELWAADAGGEKLSDAKAPAKLAIAVGNEGAGLSEAVRGLAARVVGLPIAKGVESLNVAVATGIILYELGK